MPQINLLKSVANPGMITAKNPLPAVATTTQNGSFASTAFVHAPPPATATPPVSNGVKTRGQQRFTARSPVATALSPTSTAAARKLALGINTTSSNPLDENRLLGYLLDNISPPDAHPGAVIAATSRTDPPYYFHWVRDAALVMSVIAKRCAQETDPQKKKIYLKMLKEYVWFSYDNQNQPTLTGLGEPKFYVNGTPYSGPWGRPQNDGPALRAITLIKFAKILIDAGEKDFVTYMLYDSRLPSTSVIKTDLEYIAHHWQDPCFDLWEEVKGMHFYTLLSQRRALFEGATLARSLHDPHAATFFEKQAMQIEKKLLTFWNPQKGILVATRDHVEGLDTKTSELDVAVILAALHTPGQDDLFSVTDDRILSTADKLISIFENLYPINQQGLPATTLGRYPEDTYYDGNPWVLTTAAIAELCFSAAKKFEKIGAIVITPTNLAFLERALTHNPKPDSNPELEWRQIIPAELPVLPFVKIQQGYKPNPTFSTLISALRHMGDAYLKRLALHANPDGRFNEQIHKISGHMISAENLTWSYASLLSALSVK